MTSIKLSTLGSALAVAYLAVAGSATGQRPPSTRGPIIDVHLHGGPAPQSPFYNTDKEFLRFSMAEFDRHNVVLALTSTAGAPRYAAAWRAADPERLVVGPHLTWRSPWPDTAWVRREYAAGRMGIMGELGYLYLGLAPTDAKVQSLFALAHEFDVPVAVHTGRRARETLPAGCCPDFNDDYGDPALLRPILERYPGLRLYLLHVGGRNAAYFDHAIALMRDHPNVYADMSVVATRVPEVFHGNLRRLIQEGLLDRIMFGSDGADFIGANVEAFDAVPFLTREQKRAIFYGNAARFLRLEKDQIARHHRGRPPGGLAADSLHYVVLNHGRRAGDLIPLRALRGVLPRTGADLRNGVQSPRNHRAYWIPRAEQDRHSIAASRLGRASACRGRASDLAVNGVPYGPGSGGGPPYHVPSSLR